MNLWAKSSVAALLLVGGAGAPPAIAADELTLWMPGSCDPATCLNKAMVDAFEATNPGFTIKIVTQPGDSYYTALLAASITGTGPDIAIMWPGGYMTPYKPYMTDINQFVPADVIKQSIGTAYFSEDNDTSKATYGAPTENQWYNGFYNKDLFAQAGIASPPTTWAELKQACEALKAKGITPIIEGPEGSDAQFQPIFEFSYLATVLPIEKWNDLYDGKMKYNSPELVAQLSKWADLYKAGCYNKDAFNHQNTDADFAAGKGAMFFGTGSWSIASLGKTMGDKLGVLIPPFSDTPQNAIIATAGSAFAVMTYSSHKDEAGKFLAFVLGDGGQKALAKITAPTRPGFDSSVSQINELVTKSTTAGARNYPMFDDFTQPPVTDALVRNISQVLVGQMAPADALAAMDAALDGVPADQKVDIGLKGN